MPYSIYLSTSDLLSIIISNTNTHKISCCNDAMDHVDCVIKHDVYPQKMHLCSKNIRGISFFVLNISVVYQEKKIYNRCYCIGISLVER